MGGLIMNAQPPKGDVMLVVDGATKKQTAT